MPRPVLTPLDGVAIIGTDELADAAVTGAKVADNTLVITKLAASAYSQNATANTLAQRDANGRIQTTAPNTNADVVNLGYLSPPWTYLTMTAGWAAVPGYELPAFARLGGIVYLSGGAQNNSGGSLSSIGTLPVGWRPPISVLAPATIGFPDVAGRVLQITSAGVISLDSGAGAGRYISFTAVFRAA